MRRRRAAADRSSARARDRPVDEHLSARPLSTPWFGALVRCHGCSRQSMQSLRRFYLVTDVEGMWRGTHGGATWKQIGGLPAPLSSGVMQINRANPSVLYYGGGVRGASLGLLDFQGWRRHVGAAERLD